MTNKTKIGQVKKWHNEDIDAMFKDTSEQDIPSTDVLNHLESEGDLPVQPLGPIGNLDGTFIKTLTREPIAEEKAIEPLTESPTPKITTDLDDISKSPHRQVYQDSVNFWYHPQYGGGTTFQDGHAYELARFRTGEQIGFVKQIWNHVQLFGCADFNLMWPRNDPFFSWHFNLKCTWHLRTMPNKTVDKSPWLDTDTKNIPGVPCEILPYWKEMRFLWGAYNTVKILVAKHQTLRMFISLDGDVNTIRWVGGRLVGYNQISGSEATEYNARHEW